MQGSDGRLPFSHWWRPATAGVPWGQIESRLAITEIVQSLCPPPLLLLVCFLMYCRKQTGDIESKLPFCGQIFLACCCPGQARRQGRAGGRGETCAGGVGEGAAGYSGPERQGVHNVERIPSGLRVFDFPHTVFGRFLPKIEPFSRPFPGSSANRRILNVRVSYSSVVLPGRFVVFTTGMLRQNPNSQSKRNSL